MTSEQDLAVSVDNVTFVNERGDTAPPLVKRLFH